MNNQLLARVTLPLIVAAFASTACGAPPEEAADESSQSSDAIVASAPLTPAERGFVKWNPGNYILGTGTEATQADRFLDQYGSIAKAIGLQKEYGWGELEGKQGQYRWQAIDADLAKLASAGKKLAIVVRYKYDDALPTYVRNMLPAEGVPPVFTLSGGGPYNHGQHANMGHPGTRARMIALLHALAARYDENPNVVSISFPETSIGASVTAAVQDKFLDGIILMNSAAAHAFKHTPVFQNLNFPRNRLADFTDNFVACGMGLGGPDVFFDALKYPDTGLGYDKPNQPKGVYHYYPVLAPTIPIGQQIHNGDLLFPTHEAQLANQPHGLAPAVSIDKNYDFAIGKLESNFIFWQLLGDDPYATALKNRLQAPAGLPVRKGCPAVYGGRCK